MSENITINRPRTTELIAELFPPAKEDWLSLCETNHDSVVVSEQEVLDWSSDFGSHLHALCLEGVPLPDTFSKEELEIAEKCKAQFDLFVKDYCPKTRFTEEKYYYSEDGENVLYHGTVDWGVLMNRQRCIIDLKFWGVWRWRFKYPTPTKSSKINAKKSAKANLQTELYQNGVRKKFSAKKRFVLWINPEFYRLKEFQRSSPKFEQALELAREKSKKSNLNF